MEDTELKGLTWKLDVRVDMITHFITFSKTVHSSLPMMYAGMKLEVIDLSLFASDVAALESKWVLVLRAHRAASFSAD